METSAIDNRRIAKNTIMLYIRMLFLMAINLYTSRIVLHELGVEDYGIYNAVGGFVAMFSMISTSLSGAISRYITFSLAKDSKERLIIVFSSSVIIQLILCFVLVFLSETIAVWFLNNKMVIPEKRIIAANWVFQFSVLTFIINLLSVPYNALLIAHEKMSAFAYIGIFEGLANLSIAYFIGFSPIDSLVFYSFLMALVSILIRFLYGWYCSKHFPECHFQFSWDKHLLYEMLGFAGWNFIGSASGILRSQGINILINIFCGPAVNAARGIAMQVNRALSLFSANFTTAVRPQITKSYAIGDKIAYESLCIKCSKFSFIILMVLCLPVIFESDFILHIWLYDVPKYASEFVQIILVLTLIESYSHSLVYLLLASGDIKKYQLMVGGTQLLNFPLAFVVLKLGFSPILTVGTVIFVSILCLILRLYLVHQKMNFPVLRFLKEVVLKTIFLFLISIIPALFINRYFAFGWIKFFANIISIELTSISAIFFFGLTHGERHFIIKKLVFLKSYVEKK